MLGKLHVNSNLLQLVTFFRGNLLQLLVHFKSNLLLLKLLCCKHENSTDEKMFKKLL